MRNTMDARGENCPVPVVKAKKALREQNGGESLVVLVDNEASMENLLKLAAQLGRKARGEKQGNDYSVEFYPEGGPQDGTDLETAPAGRAAKEKQGAPVTGSTVVVISSDKMGTGEDELGDILMKGFFYALAGLEELPDCILFYNGGVRLTCGGSKALADIREMESQGVEILSCGTCLDYYRLKDQLAVGQVTNMYAIAEKQMEAGRIIRP